MNSTLRSLRHCRNWPTVPLLVTLLILGQSLMAQVSTYEFTPLSGTYTEVTDASATRLITVEGDDVISATQNIGFNFGYAGNTYTQFKMSSNGFITLNTALTSSLNGNDMSAANATGRPIIAPLWDDLDGRPTGLLGRAYHELTGSAPNRVLTVEWRNWEWNWSSSANAISFQVKLFEANGTIEFHYRQGPDAGNPGGSGGASIGLTNPTGSGSGSYLNLTSVATPAVSSTVLQNAISTKPPTGTIYRFSIPSCPQPGGLLVTGVTDTDGTFSWSSASGALNYTYEVRTSGAPGSGGAGLVTSGTQAGTSVDLAGLLTQSTAYTAYVRSNCSGPTQSVWASLAFSSGQIPVSAFPWIVDFDSPTGMQFTSAGQTNQWFIGAAQGNPANSLYISNTGGSTNNYNNGATSVVHAFRDIQFPADGAINLSFDWLVQGESCCDYLRVFLVPVSFTPTAGNMITPSGSAPTGNVQLGGNFNLQGINWQTAQLSIPAAYLNNSARLVFQWRNDGSIGSAPVAVDNIQLTVGAPPCAGYTAPADGTSIEADAGTTLTWNAANGATGYDVYLDTSNPPTTLVSSDQAGLSYNTGLLTAGNTYYWQVLPRNSSGAAEECTVRSFTTMAPACIALPTSPANGGIACEGTVTNLTWPASLGATQYEVYLVAGAGPATTLVSTQAGTTFNAGTLAGGSYSWRVVPLNTNGTATGCPEWSFDVTDTPPGDTFANAVEIPILPATITGNNNLESNCYTSGSATRVGRDKIFSVVTSPCTSTLTVGVCGTGDSFLYLLAGDATTIIASDDDTEPAGCPNTVNSFLSGIAVSPNTLYYIVVEPFGATADITFDLTVSADCFCLAPAADVTVNENCTNETFTVDVDVTSFGSGSSAEITYTVDGGAPTTISGLSLGTTTIGGAGFPASATVDITLGNGSVCEEELGSYFSNCPVTIDCSASQPLTVVHCYGNLDGRTFTFEASDPGATLDITFDSGEIDPGDGVTFYDGPVGSTQISLPPYAGDLANLGTITSPGDVFSISIESNSSISCADGGGPLPWSFRVRCSGCLEPQGDVYVTDVNCINGTFMLEVDLFDLGYDEIMDDYPASAGIRWTVSPDNTFDGEMLGLVEDLHEIGPFPLNNEVNVVLVHINDGICNANKGDFTNPVGVCPPANDDCANAFVVGNGVTPFNNLAATGTDITTCTAGDNTDVWYAYTATCTGLTTVNTCGATFNTSLSAWSACGGTELACNDDFCGTQSQISFVSNSGTTYLIRVAGANGETGTGNLTISCAVPPPTGADNCALAPTVGNGAHAFSNVGATGTDITGCTFNDNLDVWFRYVATCTGNVTANTCAGASFDTGISAWTACGGTEIACNDDFCGVQSQIIFSATAGTAYWIRIAGFNGQSGTGTLTLSCTAPEVCTYSIPASGNNSITVCSWTICDPGGTSNYANNSNGYTVINPATPGDNVRLTFNSFALECCCDFVRVYDGVGLGAPQLFSGNCTTLPPALTASGGPLTVQFTSDGSVTNTGFNATISCVTPPPPACAAAPTYPANGSTLCFDGTLVWPAVPTAGGYDVYLNGDLVSSNQPGTTYNAGVLVGAINWQIIPRNSGGAAADCAIWTFTGNNTPSVEASNLGPACTGENVQLVGASTVQNVSWSGPNGYSSPLLNPVITNVGLANAGIYTLTADNGSCTFSASTTLVVNQTPVSPTTEGYAICQNGAVPGGQGLTAVAPPFIPATTTNTFDGAPFPSEGTTYVTVSTLAIPALPTGSVVTGATLTLTGVVATSPSWRSEVRVELTGAYTLGETQLSNLNSAGTITPDPVIALPGFPAGGGTVNLRFRESFNDGVVPDATIAGAFITVNYDAPGDIDWYDAASGGSLVGTNTPFNPVLANAVDASVGGFYTFYASVGDANCESVRIPAVFSVGDKFLNLELNTDLQASQTSWEVQSTDNGLVVCEGGPYFDGFALNLVESCCVPDGCYALRVFDSAGDGITNGGYTLRSAADNRRIIDNRNNGDFGSVSQITGNAYSFCMPMGDDELIYTSCDKYWWRTAEYIVTTENPAVSAVYVVGGANNVQSNTSGYEFWFYNPNGGYSFRKFRSHNVTDGYANIGPARTCHLKINNWAAANHIPQHDLMNVKVRGRVLGSNLPWGPACRFVRDEALALCPPTKLMDIPGNVNLSCGQFRQFIGGQRVYARPIGGATQYQWRFRIPAENVEIIRTTNNYILNFPWNANLAPPLLPGKTYEVDVRAFKGGAWCVDPLDADSVWGDICLLTIQAPPAQDGTQNIAMENDGGLSIWPNPNRGDQFWLNMEAIEEGVLTVAIDIMDLTGKRVIAREIPVNDKNINTVIDLNGDLSNGMYMVNITAGEKRWTERLVIAK